MATFKICVFEHQKRQDDKYPVSIRVGWNRSYSYIKTEFYVTDKQINKKTFELKDVFILNELSQRIVKYEELKARKLGQKINLYTAKELAEWLKQESQPGTDNSINFIAFSRAYIEKLKIQGRKSTSATLQRTVNSIVDFANGRDTISINEITAKFLEKYELYLRSPRAMVRKNQNGKDVTINRDGLSDVSVIDYMTDIRTLFNAAMSEYNDEDRDHIRVMHYPFRKYKIQRAPATERRNLSVEDIRKIKNIQDSDLTLTRTKLARDVFMLSFYLCGMNMADLYDVSELRDGRISYCRQKTKNRRLDKAFISIRVEPEAAELIDKYKDKSGSKVFDFYTRYSDSHIFSSNINKGLKDLARLCSINSGLSTYYARHSWATIARNKCGVSKDDIDLALNHIDRDQKMADVYIEKDWSVIDLANKKVIDLVNSL